VSAGPVPARRTVPVDVVEVLAAIEHARWAKWQAYLHSRCTPNPDGSLTIPADLVARWERQIATPYEGLTEREKDSDREQVAAVLPTIEALLHR